MRRWLGRHPVLGAVLALAGLLAAGLVWLMGTSAGARWAFSALSRLTSLQVEARQVEGSLAGVLRLRRVRVAWPGGSAQSDALRLDWHPLALLDGSVSVEELEARGVSIEQHPRKAEAPAPAVGISWPRLSGLPVWVECKVDSLRVEGLRIRSGNAKPFGIDRLAASLLWRHGVLSVANLQVAAPSVGVRGKVRAGFVRASLRADLALDLQPSGGTPRHLALSLDLSPSPEGLFAGPLKAILEPVSSKVSRLRLAAKLAVGKTAVRVAQFELTAPGRKGALSGSGKLLLTGKEPTVQLLARVQKLDLEPETGLSTDLAGTVEVAGDRHGYRGSFSLSNTGEGWKKLLLSGPFSGDMGAIDLSALEGRWLGGSLRGNLALAWGAGLVLRGALRGQGLQTDRVRPDWPGRVNFALRGTFRRKGGLPPEGTLDGKLLDSTLRGRALRGELRARLSKGDLRLVRAALHGDGFNASAHGSLKGKVAFRAEVRKLSGLLPGAKGALRAEGWVRRRGTFLNGALTARGRNLSYDHLALRELSLAAEVSGQRPSFSLKATGRGLRRGDIALDAARVQLSGTREKHSVFFTLSWPEGQMRGAAEGAYGSGIWKGRLVSLSGREAATGSWRLEKPVDLTIGSGRAVLGQAQLAGTAGERLRLAADLAWRPLFGSVRAEWKKIGLAPAKVWLGARALSGRTSGRLDARWGPGGRLKLKAEARLSGKFVRKGLQFDVRNASASVAADEKGVSATTDIALARGGRLKGTFTSPAPLGARVPERGEVGLKWQDLDMGRFRPFLPPAAQVEGRLSGEVRGSLLPGHRVEMEGKTSLHSGHLQWQGKAGKVGADLKKAELTLAWRDAAFSGGFTLTLADYGRVRGTFSLPLPARLPAALEESGPVRGHLEGDMKEKGLLNALFPGLVRESRGRFAVDLGVGGTWRHPDYSGTLQLTGGGAFLLAAGIRLEKVEARGRFDGDGVDIQSFQAVSGPGRLEGSAAIRLEGWRLKSYRATIRGERFQAIDLPELQVEVSPDLSLEGSPGKLKVRGKILIPHLLATGFTNRAPVQPSSDVVIVGAARPREKTVPLALDMEVRVVLGKRVLVKAKGLDARLEGDVTIRAAGLENITGQGQIKVAQGTYSAYGVKLKITRGAVLFAGGPVTRPTLDIQASRTIQQTGSAQAVTAGVRVTGTPRNPKATLYSTPTLPDTDILSYIVLGHPLGTDSGQASLLMVAAGGLLSQGDSTVLQDKIKNRLGLSELSIESGGGNIQQSMVTVGKYLNPDLYIGIGQSLFTNTRELRLRYELSKRWQLESKMGVQSGVDLYYKIEFR